MTDDPVTDTTLLDLSRDAGRAVPALGVLGLLCVWLAAATVLDIPPVFLPSPGAVAQALLVNAPSILDHTLYTLLEVLVGWALGIAVAVSLAVGLVSSRVAYLAVYPVLFSLKIVPVIVFLPLLVLVVGVNSASRILIAVAITFYPVLLATLAGLTSVSGPHLALLRSVGASRWQQIRHVRIPSALPHIFAGLKISAPLAVQAIVLAEFLIATRGIGYQLRSTAARFESPLLFAYVVVLVALSIVLYAGIRAIETQVETQTESGTSRGIRFGVPSVPSFGYRLSRLGGALGSGVGIVGLWYLGAAYLLPESDLFLPSPVGVAAVLVGSPSLFAGAGSATLLKLGVGWIGGVCIGLGAGTAAFRSDRVRTLVHGYAVGFRAVPDIALVPLLLIWLQVSFRSAAVLILFSTFFPATIATTVGLRQMPQRQHDLLALVATDRWQRMVVRARYAVPSIFAGIKLSLVAGFASAIVAEWFVAPDGLGVLILQGMTDTNSRLVYAASVVVALLGLSLYGVVLVVERRLTW